MRLALAVVVFYLEPGLATVAGDAVDSSTVHHVVDVRGHPVRVLAGGVARLVAVRKHKIVLQPTGLKAGGRHAALVQEVRHEHVDAS